MIMTILEVVWESSSLNDFYRSSVGHFSASKGDSLGWMGGLKYSIQLYIIDLNFYELLSCRVRR